MNKPIKISWNKHKLGSLIDLIGGYAFSSQDFDSKGIPLVKIANIFNRKIKLDSSVFLQSKEKFKKFILKKNDLLIAMSGNTTGKIGTYDFDFPAYLNQRIGKFSIKDVNSIDIDFLKFTLENEKFLKNLLIDAIGGAQPNISGDQIENLNIYLPDTLKDQKNISSILNFADKSINNTEEKILKLIDLRTSIIEDLIIKMKNKVKRKDWNSFTFNDLIKNKILFDIQDGNHGSQHPKEKDYVSNGIPFIMANDIKKDGLINFQNCKKIPLHIYEKLRIGFSMPRDVLLTHKGTIGRVAIVPDISDKIMLTPQVTYYRINDQKKLNPKFLYAFFQSNTFQSKIKNLSSQSTRNYIGITEQKKLTIKFPDYEEQNEIIKIIDSIEKVITINNKILNKKKQIKKSLSNNLIKYEN